MELNESQLRHPMERPIWVVSVLLNIVILVLALLLVLYGSDWLKAHPFFAKHIGTIRTGAYAAVLAPFAIIFVRNTRRAFVKGNSVRISRAQFPLIFASFEKQCAKLGMTQMPELYVSDKAISAPAQAFSAWKENYVVLGSTFLDAKLDEIQDVYEFLLGRELGHIRLGHTTWLDELLLAYVIRIPFLQNPIAMARTLSCDRYGAYLTKNCLRGLIVQSSGRRTLKLVNPEDYL